MTDIYDHKYPPLAVVDWQKKSDDHNHGEIGHLGFRCGQCARDGPNMMAVQPSTADYWQDRQLMWQEECDTIQVRFDEAVAAHFPEHKAMNCDTCPETQTMPPKPNPPIERALKQQGIDR